jgi:CBS domain-containing protein
LWASTRASEQTAYDKWLDQTSAREEARLDRIHGAVGVIPTPLWLVLFLLIHVRPLQNQLVDIDRGTDIVGDLVDLAASLMEWRHIRHVPVEDENGRLVGLVTHRGLLRLLSRGSTAPDATSMTVREIMKPNPTSVTSTTPTLEAIEIMRRSGIGCLPVVDDNQLVGIVTSYDFLTATASLFKQHLTVSARPPDNEKAMRVAK